MCLHHIHIQTIDSFIFSNNHRSKIHSNRYTVHNQTWTKSHTIPIMLCFFLSQTGKFYMTLHFILILRQLSQVFNPLNIKSSYYTYVQGKHVSHLNFTKCSLSLPLIRKTNSELRFSGFRGTLKKARK